MPVSGATSAAITSPVDGSGNVKVNVSAGTLGLTGSVGVTTRSAAVTLTPTVTASAYSIKNVVGGLLAFPNAFGTAQSGVLQSVTLTFKSAQTVGFELFVFNANPSSSTFTDKSAPSLNAADVAKLVGSPISLTLSNSDLGTGTVYGADSVGRAIVSASTTLYAVLLTTGTPTPGSTSDVAITVHILQD